MFKMNAKKDKIKKNEMQEIANRRSRFSKGIAEALIQDGNLCDALLYTSFCNQAEGSRNSLGEAYRYLGEESGIDISEEKLRGLAGIVGQAHLSLLDLDGADDYFGLAGDSSLTDRLRDVASWYSTDVSIMKKLVKEHDPGAYKRFLVDGAFPHMLVGEDDEGFYIDDESFGSAVSELDELGIDPIKTIKDAVVRMEYEVNRNAPQRYLLAAETGDEELIKKAESFFDETAALRREGIDSLVKQYCILNGIDMVKKVQEGDSDSFFPVASNIFLVEKNGIQEIIKENLRLYTDFSRLDGYSCEKEIYECVKHDNIIEYLGSFTLEGNEFLRFALFDGKELSEFTKRENLLPKMETVRVIRTLAEVIAHLHGKGVMYMDVKSKNALYDGEETKLLDFGMAQMFDHPVDGNTVARSLLSTPAYIPPEWGAGFRVYDTSEVFQLGVLFHEMLTGRHPFAHYAFTEGDAHRESEIIRYALPNMFNRYKSPKELRGNPDVGSLLGRMLDKDPAMRPKAKEVAKALDDYVIGSILDERNINYVGGGRK